MTQPKSNQSVQCTFSNPAKFGSHGEAKWPLMEDLVSEVDFLIYSPELFPAGQAPVILESLLQ